MSDDQPQPGDTQMLQAAFQNRVVVDVPVDCPSNERIYAAVAGELSSDETLSIIDHLTDCAACAQAWQLASRLQEADASMEHDEVSDDTDTIRDNVVPLRTRSVTRALPLAAAAVLMLGVGVTLMNVDRNPDVRYRGGPVVEDPSTAPAFAQHDQLLTFSWPVSFQARRFTLNVYDVDLNLVHTVTQSSERFEVPLADTMGLTTNIFWQIEAELDTGATITSNTSSAVVILP